MEKKNTENRARVAEPATLSEVRQTPLRTPYGREKRRFTLENIDTKFHYRWGLVDDIDRFGRAQELEEYGFVVVKGDDPVKTPFAIRESNRIYVPAGKGGGKHVLYKMPMEFKQYHDAKREEMTRDQVESKKSEGTSTANGNLRLSGGSLSIRSDDSESV